MLWFKKKKEDSKPVQKERRKNMKQRAAYDAVQKNIKAAQDLVEVTKTFTATINGDPDWLNRDLLKETNK